ncbi:MAG: ATP-binding cassette domain-containing protein [Myxococcota bacterium]
MVERDIVLECKGVHHWFGEKRVLHNVNFHISRGQIVAVVGPSGCGKSTLLRAIVGTHPPRQGEILICTPEGTRRAVRAPGRDRGIVYQNYALFDFLTVLENVAFGLMLDETTIADRLLRWSKWRPLRKQHEEDAAVWLDKLGLGDAMKRYPTELSGGMRQRVALAQALIMRPELLVLDEPFGALDEATREELQRLLLTLYAESAIAIKEGRAEDTHTILIVTHELTEAIFVSDRLMGLSQYWDWKSDGHDACPGATLVYDKTAPVFDPESIKRHGEFVIQREEVYNAVFDPEVCQKRSEFVQFWKQVEASHLEGAAS